MPGNLMSAEDLNSRRSREQHSADSRKGGIASGASRRRKRSLREAADLYLSLPVTDRERWDQIAAAGVDPEDVDNQMALIVGLSEAAIKGDARAAKVLIDLLGDGKDEGVESGGVIVLAARDGEEEKA
nr:MAG TPA: hypothetical protein [Caudoviricetes sp.]